MHPHGHDPARTDPAALYAVRIHHDDHARPGYAAHVLDVVRRQLPQGAAVLDRSELYPRETLAGTVDSVRLVDAVVMIGKPPADRYSAPSDPRIDLEPIQREIAELATELGIGVLVMGRDGALHLLEHCRRTERRGGYRLVPPTAERE